MESPNYHFQKAPLAASFRSFLQEELIRRCRVNPLYSLRAFARSLNVEPSALSQILSGKRPLTEKMKLRLGSALGLSVHQLQKIPLREAPSVEEQALSEYHRIALDSFALISDWYHFAILELTHVKGFQSDRAWMARRLGLTKSEVNIAVERLFRLGLLEIKSGVWIETSPNGELSHLTPGQSSDAARKYQLQLLELSKRSVQEVPLGLRNHTSATLCFDPEDLPLAVERIRNFRRKFAKDFQPKEPASEIYQMQISFFPLTKSKSQGVDS